MSNTIPCQLCSLDKLCHSRGTAGIHIRSDLELVKPGRVLERRDYLVRQGQAQHSLYLVKSGSLKGFAISEDGLEQVVAFYFPGDLVGLDGLGTHRHHCSVVALETTHVCELSLQHLQQADDQHLHLREIVCREVGDEIASGQDMQLLLAQRSAEERLAAFLLSLSRRFQARGFSEVEFHLSMPQQDIANFLGLTPQTLSRLFATFKQAGLIDMDHRNIRLRDLAGLEDAAKLCSTCHARRQSHAA